MGTAREPLPVKLIASLLTAEPELLARVREALAVAWGAIDLQSEILPFDHTAYYDAEFGPGLQRQIVAFERLISPAELPAAKRLANELEQSLAAEGRRRVNVDPGYVSLGKLVLATTKNHAHRLYLGQGVYGEVTLAYQQGRFRPWPWTYPDYGSEEYCALFGAVRERYKAQLREVRS
ncbi:MAG: DUF4416 family protein [Chloroflexi bacterium]|nr:MAG: DUF4416 family protein [Chloroflexota bacterium]